jgi:hypothetical protein
VFHSGPDRLTKKQDQLQSWSFSWLNLESKPMLGLRGNRTAGACQREAGLRDFSAKKYL